jgi:hypothetical protein
MGMCAMVVAIGPFSPEIADCLEYPEKLYANTRVGSIVITDFFGIVEGSPMSREFAMLLGILDPWDFNQHLFDPQKIDVEGLRTLLQDSEYNEEYLEDLERMLKLRGHGFQMIFLPNG